MGYLKAIDNQKEVFKKDKFQYTLLCRKKNQIKYGVDSKSEWHAFMKYYKQKLKNLIRKIKSLGH